MGCEGEPLFCFGAIDGTIRHITRPGGDPTVQQSCYNGRKRFHAIEYQAVVAVSGIILSLFGGVPGRHNDRFMANQSHIREILRDWAVDEDGHQYFVYGDGGYTGSEYILCPSLLTTETMRKMNQAWSRQRISVEWMFGRIVNLFTKLDAVKSHKIHRSEVGLWYLFCTLLTNCYTCMKGNQVSRHFQCTPPTLEEYLTPRDPDFEKWMDRYRPDPQYLSIYGDLFKSRYNPDGEMEFDCARTEYRQI